MPDDVDLDHLTRNYRDRYGLADAQPVIVSGPLAALERLQAAHPVPPVTVVFAGSSDYAPLSRGEYRRNLAAKVAYFRERGMTVLVGKPVRFKPVRRRGPNRSDYASPRWPSLHPDRTPRGRRGSLRKPSARSNRHHARSTR